MIKTREDCCHLYVYSATLPRELFTEQTEDEKMHLDIHHCQNLS